MFVFIITDVLSYRCIQTWFVSKLRLSWLIFLNIFLFKDWIQWSIKQFYDLWFISMLNIELSWRKYCVVIFEQEAERVCSVLPVSWDNNSISRYNCSHPSTFPVEPPTYHWDWDSSHLSVSIEFKIKMNSLSVLLRQARVVLRTLIEQTVLFPAEACLGRCCVLDKFSVSGWGLRSKIPL